MTNIEQPDEEVSLFALGTTLLQSRWRILRWMFAGAVLAAGLVMLKPIVYRASASFVSQSNDASRSGLASLAGQFGVALPTGGQSFSPEFYAKLLNSRVLLLPIVHDTFVVPEMRNKRIAFLDLFEIQGKSTMDREEQGINFLKSLVAVNVDKNTGIIAFSVETQWRSVSVATVAALLEGVNNYNQRTRQGQAAAERQFVERRLALASASLREAEDRYQRFLQTNRDLSAPALMLERERLQRDVSSRQQSFLSLTQAYEDARVREVRDTPVISVFEPPSAPARPQSRHGLVGVALGLLLGGFIGIFSVFVSEMMSRYRSNSSTVAHALVGAVDDRRWS